MIRNLLFIILFLLFLPLSSWAAVLYLEPARGEYYQGDTFITGVRLDTKDECINTVMVDLTFDSSILEVKDFSRGNSILTFWLKEPEISKETGLISFAGGIPGGYCGRLPGDPGETNLLGRIIFRVRETGGEPLFASLGFLDTPQVLLNDGLGTPAKLTTLGAIFTIMPGTSEVPKKEWQEELEKDKTPPEFFKIEINRNSSIFEGKYFIVFSTTDKQTGIDHYEVKEGKKDWKRTESPYLLADQALGNIIKVKAVDKAGNEIIAEYVPPKKLFPYWIIILVLIVIIWWIRKKRRRLKSRI